MEKIIMVNNWRLSIKKDEKEMTSEEKYLCMYIDDTRTKFKEV